MRVLVETRTDKIGRPVNFSDRNVEDAKDGYYQFVKKDQPQDQIWCYRLDAGVQVRFMERLAAGALLVFFTEQSTVSPCQRQVRQCTTLQGCACCLPRHFVGYRSQMGYLTIFF